jgi:hypothetical protein
MPHHYFMRSTGGLGVVVVADTAAAAEALLAAAGYPRVGARPYRADPQDLRAHAGAFRLVGPWSASAPRAITLAPAADGDRDAELTLPRSVPVVEEQQRQSA